MRDRMTKKLCPWNECEIQIKQNEVEDFIENLFDSGLKLLQFKYPDHNPDCLQRIFAERMQSQHHYLIGELIEKNLIEKEKKRSEVQK